MMGSFKVAGCDVTEGRTSYLFFLSFAKIFYIVFYSSYVSICKDLAEDDYLIVRPFFASIYIYNTMYL